MNNWTNYIWIADVFLIAFVYVVAGAILYLARYRRVETGWVLDNRRERLVRKDQLKRELSFSATTLLIYAALGYMIFRMRSAGYTMVYTDLSQKGMIYFFLSILFMILVHDTYFYWTHRLLHLPPVFRVVHRVHHRSHQPTPWTAFSFHPLEAVVQAGIVPLIVFTLPVHPAALFIFLAFMTIINVAGHCGYEILPAWFRNSRLGRWQNTPGQHERHHLEGKHNYGLYFTFWDRLMKTERNN